MPCFLIVERLERFELFERLERHGCLATAVSERSGREKTASGDGPGDMYGQS